MLLGFKRQFAPFVRDGSKRHTIRSYSSRIWEIGDRCDCYVDPRQKTMELLGRWPCVKTQPINIVIAAFFPAPDVSPLHVLLDGVSLDVDETEALFFADGFRAPSERRYPATSEAADFWRAKLLYKAFNGVMIHWDYDNPVNWREK